MADALQTLLAKDAVARVIHDLFRGTDERQWERVRACFAEEVHFDVTSLAGGEPTTLTPRQITSAWEEGLRPIRDAHHQVGNLQIDVHGDEAEAYCYGIATHHRPEAAAGKVRTFVGSYDLRLRRAGEAWRVDLFRFNLRYIDGNVDLERS